MNLNDLKQVIPFEFKPLSYNEYKPELALAGYIDARDVMTLLDNVVGVENWQRDHKSLNDSKGQAVTFCGIGLYLDSQWIWKWDSGEESRMSATKGASSDSFKRSAVSFGVGRFLYELKSITLKANDKKWDYHEQLEYKGKRQNLYPVDESGKRIYDINEYVWTNRLFEILEKISHYDFSPYFIKFIKKYFSQDLFQAVENLEKSGNFEELWKKLNIKDRKIFEIIQKQRKSSRVTQNIDNIIITSSEVIEFDSEKLAKEFNNAGTLEELKDMYIRACEDFPDHKKVIDQMGNTAKNKISNDIANEKLREEAVKV